MSNAVRGSAPCRVTTATRVSVSQITTLPLELRRRRAARTRPRASTGIGIWELKLPEGGDAEALELLEASGLESASAIPARPVDPAAAAARRARPIRPSASRRYCASLHRLAPFRPAGVVCLTGTGAGRDPDDARATVVDGLRTIAAEAESARPAHRARAVPARRRRAVDDRVVDPGGGRADRRGRRPAGARDPVRRLAPLEHADARRGHRARDRPLRRRARLRLARADPRLGRPRAPRRGRRRRRRASSARSTPRAGTASTTSRSSPTTARSAPRTPTRSGTSPPDELLPGPRRVRPRLGGACRVLDPGPRSPSVPPSPSSPCDGTTVKEWR